MIDYLILHPWLGIALLILLAAWTAAIYEVGKIVGSEQTRKAWMGTLNREERPTIYANGHGASRLF